MIILLFFVSSVFAEIYDPQGYLQQLDQKFIGHHFTEQFVLNSGAKFHQKECVLTGGRNTCDESRFLTKVASVDLHTARLETFVENYPRPAVREVTASQWEAINHNWLRDELAELESFGLKLTAYSLENKTIQMLGRNLEVSVIKFGGNLNNRRYDHEFWVAPSLSGIRQIVYRKDTRGGSFPGVLEKTLIELLEP